MLKISRFADYAVIVMTGLCRDAGAHQSAAGLAVVTSLPEPTVSKILKMLVKGGLLDSVRGVRGGYKLSRPPAKISMSDIVTAIDGPIALTACTEGSGETCQMSGKCAMHGRWNPINQAMKTALEGVTLADMLTTSVTLRNVRSGVNTSGRVFR